MRFYGYWRSSSAWRVRIALHHKDLPFEYVPVHLLEGGGQQHTPAYRAKNPMEQVPLLEIEDEGRTIRIGQSMAILEYLEERHPDPPLLPRDPILRAKARQLAEIVNSGIQPLQNLGVLQHVQAACGSDERAWARHWVSRGLAALEAATAETAGTYAVGDAVSFADCCIVPQLYAARRFGVDVEPFPTLLRVEAACAVLPAFEAARPENQRDAPPPSQATR